MDWLAQLNIELRNKDFEETLDGNIHDSIFIVGAPRSGTTILSQFFYHYFDVGYVNNLMACFWQAPIYGALLSQKMIKEKNITSQSSFGQTKSISDPHEFGAFWRHMLNSPDMDQKSSSVDIDFFALGNKLDRISQVFDKPVSYKVFQLAWHIVEYQNVRPGTRWIWIEMDIIYNALSLLKLRESLHGDREIWASSKPLSAIGRSFDNFYQEVVFQVLAINHFFKEQLKHIDSSKYLHIIYEDFASHPEGYLGVFERFSGINRDASSDKSFLRDIRCYQGDQYAAEDREFIKQALCYFQEQTDYQEFFK